MGTKGMYGSTLLALGLTVDSEGGRILPNTHYTAETTSLRTWMAGDVTRGSWSILPTSESGLEF